MRQEDFKLRTFAVPRPGGEMGARVLDIAQRYRAAFVITHYRDVKHYKRRKRWL